MEGGLRGAEPPGQLDICGGWRGWDLAPTL